GRVRRAIELHCVLPGLWQPVAVLVQLDCAVRQEEAAGLEATGGGRRRRRQHRGEQGEAGDQVPHVHPPVRASAASMRASASSKRTPFSKNVRACSAMSTSVLARSTIGGSTRASRSESTCTPRCARSGATCLASSGTGVALIHCWFSHSSFSGLNTPAVSPT